MSPKVCPVTDFIGQHFLHVKFIIVVLSKNVLVQIAIESISVDF